MQNSKSLPPNDLRFLYRDCHTPNHISFSKKGKNRGRRLIIICKICFFQQIMNKFDSWCRTIQNKAPAEMQGLCCFWRVHIPSTYCALTALRASVVDCVLEQGLSGISTWLPSLRQRHSQFWIIGTKSNSSSPTD